MSELLYSRLESEQEVTLITRAMQEGGWKPTRKTVDRLVDHLRDSLRREGYLDSGAAHLNQLLIEKEDRHAKETASLKQQHHEYVQNLARGR